VQAGIGNGSREKAPKSNIQASEKIQAPNFKRRAHEIWSFVFDVSLELGAWDLKLLNTNRPAWAPLPSLLSTH
jgi:hypothetical protein